MRDVLNRRRFWGLHLQSEGFRNRPAARKDASPLSGGYLEHGADDWGECAATVSNALLTAHPPVLLPKQRPRGLSRRHLGEAWMVGARLRILSTNQTRKPDHETLKEKQTWCYMYPMLLQPIQNTCANLKALGCCQKGRTLHVQSISKFTDKSCMSTTKIMIAYIETMSLRNSMLAGKQTAIQDLVER